MGQTGHSLSDYCHTLSLYFLLFEFFKPGYIMDRKGSIIITR